MTLVEQGDVLTEFRLIFIFGLLVSILIFFISLIPKGRNSKINMNIILTLSILNLLNALLLLYTENKLLKSTELVADRLTFYLFLAIVFFSILNPIIFKQKNRKNQRYRYRR